MPGTLCSTRPPLGLRPVSPHAPPSVLPPRTPCLAHSLCSIRSAAALGRSRPLARGRSAIANFAGPFPMRAAPLDPPQSRTQTLTLRENLPRALSACSDPGRRRGTFVATWRRAGRADGESIFVDMMRHCSSVSMDRLRAQQAANVRMPSPPRLPFAPSFARRSPVIMRRKLLLTAACAVAGRSGERKGAPGRVRAAGLASVDLRGLRGRSGRGGRRAAAAAARGRRSVRRSGGGPRGGWRTAKKNTV